MKSHRKQTRMRILTNRVYRKGAAALTVKQRIELIGYRRAYWERRRHELRARHQQWMAEILRDAGMPVVFEVEKTQHALVRKQIQVLMTKQNVRFR